MKLTNEFESIRQWASKRGLYEKGDRKTQTVKLLEEVGELARSILKEDYNQFTDSIGDIVVVLTNLAELGDAKIESCINNSFKVIENRTGKMVNGTFTKDK